MKGVSFARQGEASDLELVPTWVTVWVRFFDPHRKTTICNKKSPKTERLSPIGTQCEPMGLKLLWGKESVGYGVAISHWFWDYMRHKAEGADHIQE